MKFVKEGWGDKNEPITLFQNNFLKFNFKSYLVENNSLSLHKRTPKPLAAVVINAVALIVAVVIDHAD